MRRRFFTLVFFLLSLSCSQAYGQVTAIKAGRLVDPETGTTALNQIIIVEKGKITAVGGGVAIPSGASVIDLSRATVLPGLFDMHTHLCMDVQATCEAVPAGGMKAVNL